MIHRNDRGEHHIIFIMLSDRLNSSPTLPPPLFFSVNNLMHPLCPSKF